MYDGPLPPQPKSKAERRSHSTRVAQDEQKTEIIDYSARLTVPEHPSLVGLVDVSRCNLDLDHIRRARPHLLI